MTRLLAVVLLCGFAGVANAGLIRYSWQGEPGNQGWFLVELSSILNAPVEVGDTVRVNNQSILNLSFHVGGFNWSADDIVRISGDLIYDISTDIPQIVTGAGMLVADNLGTLDPGLAVFPHGEIWLRSNAQWTVYGGSWTARAVPEPGSLGLLAGGLLALGLLRRWKQAA